jgi:hypothetical protein
MARKRKLTKTEQARIDAETEARLAAYEAFSDRFRGRVFKAQVVWFDRVSGEAWVRGLGDDSDVSMPLYACNIPGKRTWYPETACVYFERDATIDVEIHPSLGCSLLVAHTPGIQDDAKWNGLDQSKLAFRCDESGNAINGLFA